MKEVTIKFKDSRVLALLKSLAAYFDFSIDEKQSDAGHNRKKVSFKALKLDTRGYKFNREEANER